MSAGAQRPVRFQSEIFDRYDTLNNIPYGAARTLKGIQQTLLLDLFSPPKGDTMLRRPLMIFIHGGGFQSNTKVTSFGTRVCSSLAKRGYVASSIEYRLGIAPPKNDTAYFAALYRAVQDAKAAVRFFRRHADRYGIDTSQIFVMGSSAGAKTALHMAYLDAHELPAYVDTTRWGTLEGTSGNAGYSSRVHGVVNCWGAMVDYRWLQRGSPPLYNIAGVRDTVVSADSSFAYHGFRYGPAILFEKCLTLGIPTGYRPFLHTGHTLDNNAAKQDSAVTDLCRWLYTQLRYHGGSNEGVFRWEKAVSSFAEADRQQPDPPNAILVAGSSYIRLWDNIQTDLAPHPIIQRGFGGSNLRDMAYYVRSIVSPHPNVKAIVFYTGSNDVTAGPKDKAPHELLEMFKFVVKTVRQTHPQTPIFWIQISPNERRWAVWEQIKATNQLFQQYATQVPNVHVITAAAALLGADGKPYVPYFRDDKLHLNAEGYRVWAKAIRPYLDKL